MPYDLRDYFERRVEEEEQRAAASTHPGVKTAHETFAAVYRAELVARQEMPDIVDQLPDAAAND